MSTRATFHFVDPEWPTSPQAIVYRHMDGNPEEAGAQLLAFVDRVDRLKDKRFDDPSLLAARYVAFLGEHYAFHYDDKFRKVPNEDYLDFISVGILTEDPGDIAYRYTIVCDGKPTITVEGYGDEENDTGDLIYLGNLRQLLNSE